MSVFYVHSDHLNTPRRISRPTDNIIVWRWDSDPFGTAAANEDPDGDSNLFIFNSRFPGQYYDPETELTYNYMRHYDATTGRYVEADRIGLGGGVNLYAYALANPVSMIDSLGLLARCEDNFKIDEGIRRVRESRETMYSERKWFEFAYQGFEADLSSDPESLFPGRGPPIRPDINFNFDFYWVWIQSWREDIYDVGKKWEDWSLLCRETLPDGCGGFKTRVWTKRERRDAGEAYRILVDTKYFTRRQRVPNDDAPGFGLP